LLGFAGHFLFVGRGRLKLVLPFLLHAMLDGWVVMREDGNGWRYLAIYKVFGHIVIH